MNVFLTGATGFIGSHVMHQLLSRGDSVYALSRNGEDNVHLQQAKAATLKVVRGDLLQPESFMEALAQCDAAIHVAGWISTRKTDVERLRTINVIATENLWQACDRTRCHKIVYLASIFAHGRSTHGRPCDESTPFDPGILDLPVPYFRAKRQAELLSWQYVEHHGLPIVFGYPGYCIGPGDYYLSSMRVVRDFLKGRVPSYVNGGMNFIDVRDAASGLIACLDKGRLSQKYLLGNHNIKWQAFFETLAKVTSRSPPRFAAPYSLALLGGRILERVWGEGPIAQGDIAVMGNEWYYESSKAIRELGLPQRPLSESLEDGVRWLHQHDLLDHPAQD